jgi:oligoribonuclease NrnB/cAMP/cGMP phosphodiesterase (DHH superfamily)
MNPNELTPYGEALEKIIELQDLLIEEQKEVLRLMVDVEALKVKELTDEEIWKCIKQFTYAKYYDDFFKFAKKILRKASKK